MALEVSKIAFVSTATLESDPVLDALLASAHQAGMVMSLRASKAEREHPPLDGMLRMAESGRGQILAQQKTIEELNARIEQLVEDNKLMELCAESRGFASGSNKWIEAQSYSMYLEDKLQQIEFQITKMTRQILDVEQSIGEIEAKKERFETEKKEFKSKISALELKLKMKERTISCLRQQVLDAQETFQTEQEANEAYKQNVFALKIRIERRQLVQELEEARDIAGQEFKPFVVLEAQKAEALYNIMNNLIGKI